MANPPYTGKDLVEKVYPGILAKIADLGAGTFMDDEVKPTYAKDNKLQFGKTGIAKVRVLWTIRFGIRYVFTSDRMLLRIVTTAQGDGTTWERESYNYHCGPDPYDDTNTLFRVDLHPPLGLHAHLLPNVGAHIPPSKVTPDLATVDAFAFVEMVRSFRATKVYPLKLKGAP